MTLFIRAASFLLVACMLAVPAFGAPSKKSAGIEELNQYAAELRQHPGDKALREKIIKVAAGMKPAPPVPEEAERSMARGSVFAKKASDNAGYRRAIAEFQAAASAAPWLGLAYYNLGVVQERAGLFGEAIQSLKYYLLSAPDAKNARDVKNNIYALEADEEAVQAGMNAPKPAPEAAAPAAGSPLDVAGKSTLAIELEAPLKIIKLPRDKKAKAPDFTGNWCFKENIRGEDVIIHAFEIAKNADGDLTLIPPKRVADSVATVNVFEINDRALKIQMRWRMRSVVGYWKTETYTLALSADGTKLTGAHNQQSVGGRNIDLDRVLFRQ